MTNMIHPSAVIAESAILGNNVKISPFCVIGENTKVGEGTVLGSGCILADGVQIGANSILGNHVSLEEKVTLNKEVNIGNHTTVYSCTDIGEGTYIGNNSTIGRPPRASFTSTVKSEGDLPPLTVGSRSIIGCSAVIYAGTVLQEGVFVGDRALIREHCVIGTKVVVGSGCAVENNTKIGAYTKIQTGSYTTAYMEIEERVFIAPMVTTTNDNYMGRTEKRFQYIKGATIRKGARIGGAAILLPGVEIGEETFVAAGALVTKDTPSHKVVKGFPAKPFKDVPEDELIP